MYDCTPMGGKGWFLSSRCMPWFIPNGELRELLGFLITSSIFFHMTSNKLYTQASVWEPIEGSRGDFCTWMGLLWSFWPRQSHRWTDRGASPQYNMYLHQRAAEHQQHWAPGQSLVGCGTQVLVVWWFKAITVMHVVVRSLKSLNGYEVNLLKRAEQNWGDVSPEHNSKGKTVAGKCMQVGQSFRYPTSR